VTVAKLDAARELGLRRELYGSATRRQRGEVEIVGEVHAAARALATTTESWATFLPRPAAIESAQTCVVGLGRLLGELRARQEAGGPPDAA